MNKDELIPPLVNEKIPKLNFDYKHSNHFEINEKDGSLYFKAYPLSDGNLLILKEDIDKLKFLFECAEFVLQQEKEEKNEKTNS